ncbi:hypothetical protein AB0L75_28125 [Streptomyces sp. NPDC052101]
MDLDTQFATLSSPFLALLTVLCAVALSHPEPEIRVRAERLLAVIFRSR